MTAEGMFEVGDRVTRPKDVYNRSPLMHGTVTRRYGQDGGLDGVKWHDPELYEVRWDDGYVQKGFFRHGLDLEGTVERR
jgi:hypothetical protein